MPLILLEEFLRTGEFGPLHPGMSRAEVETAVGGLPDAWTSHDVADISQRLLSSPSQLYMADAWKYGKIELHYAAKGDTLILIYSDEFQELHGDNVLTLDPWILYGGISRHEVVAALQQADIAYQQVTHPIQHGVHVITSGGVDLFFLEGPKYEEFGAEDHAPGLYSVSKASPEYFATHDLVPLEYELIGHIEHFWGRVSVVGVRLLPGAILDEGQEIAFRLPAPLVRDKIWALRDPFSFRKAYFSQAATDLHIESSAATSDPTTALITLKTALTKQQARKGLPVYKIWPAE